MVMLSPPRTLVGVATLAPACRGRAIATLTRAFSDDPPCRWLWPSNDEYETYFPSFAAAFGGAAIERGTAVATAELAGVALWMAPGVGPDEQGLGALIERSVPAHRQKTVFDVLAEMGRVHPNEPHWYLPLVGVEPERQGQGIGATLLRAVLAQCDATGLPAYLEATSDRSIPLYSRHGFEPVGEIVVGDCPPIVPMMRRSAGSR